MPRLNSYFKGRLKKYFEVKLGAFDYRNGWMKSDCPYCGHPGKFGINLTRNQTHCFRCDIHPSPMMLVMHLENTDSYSDTFKLLESDQYSGYVFKEVNPVTPQMADLDLPEGFFLLNQGTSQIAKSARSYMIKRGFDIDEMSRRGWGYSAQGKYFGYIIIPFHYQGRLIYFNARNFLGSGPRYNNPEANKSGIGKSYLIYNRDALDMYKSIYVCEGAMNAATMGDRAIATSGKAVSRYQINEMIKSPAERFTLLLDPDAKEEAVDLALKLVEYKRVRVVFLPSGKDCNDLGRKAVMKYVLSTPYSSYSQLLNLKASL